MRKIREFIRILNAEVTNSQSMLLVYIVVGNRMCVCVCVIRVVGHQVAPHIDRGFELYPAPATYRHAPAVPGLDK